ncbi:MAG: glucuronate isomerase [Verrucomicrobiota bacterium]|nr:glucuronate isomerase [Verrucomicrobiota bacterium]MDG1892342.1 glucuronate isomerase [Verrucomicrobiota bacterium]
MIISNQPLSTSRGKLYDQVHRIVQSTPALDMHTHLYDPAFGDLLLSGIDEQLVYHYLVAETFRSSTMGYEDFWKLPRAQQADHVWSTLFQERSPISEACRGVLTSLHLLGLETGPKSLPSIRQWFKEQDRESFVSRCLEIANLRGVCMTNSPFDPEEKAVWDQSPSRDSRFQTGLRLDPLLLDWPVAGKTLADWGYEVSEDMGGTSVVSVTRFLEDWRDRIHPLYLMVSLPPDFTYPADDHTTRMLQQVILPFCRASGLPLALMIGVRRSVNPFLQLAGDGVGRADLSALQCLCAENQDVKFLSTLLSRENQHELCVLGRKFRNLHIFGCWWFTNVPSMIQEMTRMRLELLGTSFTAQHSDARVLDQVLYKWDHSRRVIADVLTDKYFDMQQTGWPLSEEIIRADVTHLLGAGFEGFCS